jgi:hypothetical protein
MYKKDLWKVKLIAKGRRSITLEIEDSNKKTINVELAVKDVLTLTHRVDIDSNNSSKTKDNWDVLMDLLGYRKELH